MFETPFTCHLVCLLFLDEYRVLDTILHSYRDVTAVILPDLVFICQNMMGRYGMQLPTGGPAAAAAAQQAAAYNAAQVAHNTYGMMQLNNAMSMMNVAGGNVPGGRDGSGGAGGGDGGAGVGGPAGGFGVPPPPGAGIGGGRSAMMRGGAEHGHPPQPVMPQMLSPTTYGSAGAGTTTSK